MNLYIVSNPRFSYWGFTEGLVLAENANSAVDLMTERLGDVDGPVGNLDVRMIGTALPSLNTPQVLFYSYIGS